MKTSAIYLKAVAAADANAAKYPDHPSMSYAWIDVADTARLVRAALAKDFPGIKFYVRSNSYSGGASIDVYYDGRSDDALWTLIDSSDNPYGDPVLYADVDHSVGRWAPILNPGMPRARVVDSALYPYKGGRFDGMIDMAYGVDSWLNPDGSAALAHSPGSTGSRGMDSPYDFPAPTAGAVRVHFGANFVFVNDTLPYDIRSKSA
jgi:hypothetical protein